MKLDTTNLICKSTIVAGSILFSAIYCRAGLFDKLDNAINAVKPNGNTNSQVQQAAVNPPDQESAANPPDQNTQVANTSTVASQPKVKAFKTLNFGDNFNTVEQQLGEIVVGGSEQDEHADLNYIGETFWRSFFDSDADYEPYKFDSTTTKQTEKFESLKNYFRDNVGVAVFKSANSAMSVSCYCLGSYSTKSKMQIGLAVVEVNYSKPDVEKLVAGFIQKFPNVQKSEKLYKIEGTMFPGVFLEFSQTIYEDINADRKAILSVPTGVFNFTFTDPSKLTKDQLDAWNALMTKDGKSTQINDYFQSVKNALLDLAKNMQANKTLDDITYQGWYYGSYNDSLIWGSPKALFVSKTILGTQFNNYIQSIAAKDQAEKAKSKNESDASTGF